MQKGSPESFAAVEKLARDTYPTAAARSTRSPPRTTPRSPRRRRRTRAPRPTNSPRRASSTIGRARLDLGGSYTTGASNSLAIYGALKLNKEGVRWRQALSGRVDYSKSAGVLSTDKDTAAYQPQYKINDRLYIYGLGQFDRDRILGFSYRFTESAGFGYTVLPGSKLHLDLEAGPAVRETRYLGDLAGDRETRLAGRGSVNFLWKPNANRPADRGRRDLRRERQFEHHVDHLARHQAVRAR